MKKNRQYIKLFQILEWNAATESAHYGSRRQNVPSGNFTSSYEKRILVLVNDRCGLVI